MTFAALAIVGLFSAPQKTNIRAFLSFHQNVLAVKTNRGWHDPTDNSHFSTKPYPAIVAGIGKPIEGKGPVSVYKDKDWGWIADPDQKLPADQVLCWGVRPRYLRKVVEIDDSKGIYRAAAMAAFKSKKLEIHHIEQIQVYRTDLRGDGKWEVVVAAQGLGKINSIAIVFVRQPLPNGVKTDILEYQEMGYPRISAIADFCGDGTMQVVVAGGISDGAMASLWSFTTLKPKRLASFVWGS